MSRPAKNVNVISKHLTEEEKQSRDEIENQLKGKSNKIKPFDYLTLGQIEIFKYIVRELTASGILGNLDVYILNRCAVVIDRLNALDRMANEDCNLLLDADFLKARKEYMADFNRCCQELCLSPQARAKIGTININKKSEDNDPLLKALKGGK